MEKDNQINYSARYTLVLYNDYKNVDNYTVKYVCIPLSDRCCCWQLRLTHETGARNRALAPTSTLAPVPENWRIKVRGGLDCLSACVAYAASSDASFSMIQRRTHNTYFLSLSLSLSLLSTSLYNFLSFYRTMYLFCIFLLMRSLRKTSWLAHLVGEGWYCWYEKGWY